LGRGAEAGPSRLAAVDVYEDEPVLGGNHPLLKLDNATLHAAPGYGRAGYLRSLFRHGDRPDPGVRGLGKPINVLNPEVLEKK